MFHRRYRQSGLSIVGVIIAFGLLGMLVVGIGKVTRASLQSSEKIKYDQNAVMLKNVMLKRFDCTATLRNITCPSEIFPARDKNGKILGKASYGAWKFGRFHIRTSCTDTEMQLEYARLIAADTFAAMPTSKEPFSWRPLYGEGMEDVIVCDLPEPPSADCTSSGDTYTAQKSGVYSVQPGTLNRTTESCPSGTIYRGTARCPEKYLPYGGGASCTIGTSKGTLVNSYMDFAANGWVSECCIDTSALAASYSCQAFVTCNRIGSNN